MELLDKRALVTGGTAGIGRETAKLFAREGASVVISGRDAGRGAETVAEIEADGGRARFIMADNADLASVERLAAEAGDVDILVNNAAVFPFAPTLEQDVATYETLFDTNVRAPYFLTAALAPKMLAKGAGSIINISTIAAIVGMPGASVYSATKAALDSLTRTWAAEFGGSGVRVNTISPGHTHTDSAVTQIGAAEFQALGERSALARTADPKEIAEVVLFLASERSSYVTGASLTVDGGITAIA
jgi:NAD(P)-dependent dehydrogenase (short-subunit alcohol dehydrogenase family)